MPRYFDHQMFLERVAILGNGEYKKAREIADMLFLAGIRKGASEE
ncbi:hypothetical protein ACIFQM_00925 [Paenibacillus sp. NRS-1782]